MTPTDIPDLDRVTPRVLVWEAPLESRPIRIGADDGPVLRPGLVKDAEVFFAAAALGRVESQFDAAAVEFALSADLRAAKFERVRLAEAGIAWGGAVDKLAGAISG